MADDTDARNRGAEPAANASASEPAGDDATPRDWIDPEAFRRPRGARRHVARAAWAGLGAGAIASAVSLLPANLGWHAPGLLSAAHAGLAGDCGACHTRAFGTIVRAARGDASARSAGDDACRCCHRIPAHAEDEPGRPPCATCHREHLGPGPTRVPDTRCVVCHAKPRGGAHGRPEVAAVTAFTAEGHPEIGAWRAPEPRDRGTVRLNHAAHLEIAKRKPDVPELRCSSCHRLDADGRLMRPVRYEVHCAGCHPVSVPVHGLAGPDAAARIGRALRAADRSAVEGPAGCRYCHAGAPIEAVAQGSAPWPAAAIRERWAPRMTHSHVAHANLQCLRCHVGARRSGESGDLLVPRLDICLNCHGAEGKALGECVECHAYHGGRARTERAPVTNCRTAGGGAR